ncbi:hypothetical protein GCK72_007746 [Caenorhabditis remanei]|uniref:Uncharacterized protein n=1 Tax=Caenorhabditis remanei TaxID=31234 RepID=A0A6A5HN82_CAERE|nr:hypothetical protein GCK72_007746 [Caenorhabditis remanei]KAF1767787.1 hypothetical protein GCK72_007746 [Caenorhabditis remanei]
MTPSPVDLSKIDYKKLLRRSVPGNGPFMGMRYQRGGNQRGGGLGGIIGAVAGLLPKLLSSVAGQQLVSAGKELASELAQGQSLKASLKGVAQKKMREFAGNGRRRGALQKRIKGGVVTVLKPHLVSKTRRDNFL